MSDDEPTDQDRPAFHPSGEDTKPERKMTNSREREAFVTDKTPVVEPCSTCEYRAGVVDQMRAKLRRSEAKVQMLELLVRGLSRKNDGPTCSLAPLERGRNAVERTVVCSPTPRKAYTEPARAPTASITMAKPMLDEPSKSLLRPRAYDRYWLPVSALVLGTGIWATVYTLWLMYEVLATCLGR